MHPSHAHAPATSANRTLILVLNVLIVLALIAALLLPPISIVDRIRYRGFTDITPTHGDVRDPDGTQVTFPDASLTGPLKAKLTSIPMRDFVEGKVEKGLKEAAQQAQDMGLIPKSPFYILTLVGSEPEAVYISIPTPNDAEPYETLDLYTWDEAKKKWIWLPSHRLPEEDRIEAVLDWVPRNFMVMQTQPGPKSATTDVPQGMLLPEEGADAVAIIHPVGIYLADEGFLKGSLAVPAPGSGVPYKIMPTIRNYENGVVRTDLLWNMLATPKQQENNIASIVELVTKNDYAGVDIDYRGVDPLQRALFTDFIARLAEQLHANGKLISVRVEPPRQIAQGIWLTGGYDWRKLGRVVDIVRVPAPIDPEAYRQGGVFDQIMMWAVGEIDRSKIQVVLPARSVEIAGSYMILKSYSEALAPIAAQLKGEGGVVQPGQEVHVQVTTEKPVSPLQFDEELFQYWYKYLDDQGNERTVWIENAASLAHKLELTDKYHVAGVTTQHLLSGDADPAIWDVLRAYQASEELGVSPTEYLVSWVVVDAEGNVLAQGETPVGTHPITVTAPISGQIRVQASLRQGRYVVGEAQEIGFTVATPTPTVTPMPTATPTPRPTPTPMSALARVNRTMNIREGPSTNYKILGQAKAGETYTIIGKNKAGTWWQVRLPGGKIGWLYGKLIQILGPVENVQVAKNIPPEPKPKPGTVARGRLPGFFDYGVQAHMDSPAMTAKVMDMTLGMHFHWVKQQIEWFRMEPSKGQIDWGMMDMIVNTGDQKGVKVMFSIVKAPRWARPGNTDFSVNGPPQNPQDYADFVGAVAKRYCGHSLKAIEVWNEQNLWYEWGHETIDPARYMQLLKAAYIAIKRACPSMIVISGALTPTGAPAPWAMDDFAYLEGMYRHGLKQYSDAIGAHPSGFNVPPDATGCHPNVQTFRGPCENPHHSWSFRLTMEGYRRIMLKYGDGAKRIWPTEFGWATNPHPVKGYEYAADNTPEEQAQFTVRAYQMMKQWGWVGVAFLWNLNFRVVAPGSEQAQWGIVDRFWNPLPAYNALKACRENGGC